MYKPITTEFRTAFTRAMYEEDPGDEVALLHEVFTGSNTCCAKELECCPGFSERTYSIQEVKVA
jgi:hypothetical protein